jgi:hypothetical protein
MPPSPLSSRAVSTASSTPVPPPRLSSSLRLASSPFRLHDPKYDKLVIACGSVNSTHGVPGLENCFQLKTVQDAQAIRRRIMDNLETAALPSTTAAERKRLLSFVVCGGGPTGVEFASEVWEMVNEDVISYMPKVLRDEISVHIIQSRGHILNTYAETISQYAEVRLLSLHFSTYADPASIAGTLPQERNRHDPQCPCQGGQGRQGHLHHQGRFGQAGRAGGHERLHAVEYRYRCVSLFSLLCAAILTLELPYPPLPTFLLPVPTSSQRPSAQP